MSFQSDKKLREKGKQNMSIKNFNTWLVESLNFNSKDMITRHLNDNENFALIGGAETEKTLDSVVKELGSKSLLLITAATAYKEDTKRKYIQIFDNLGCNTDFIDASNSEEVDTEENFNKLRVADTIFFVGGDQSKITKCYLDTLFLDELKKRVMRGLSLMGTSAGAMAMSQDMIAGGKVSPKMTKGLSIIPDIIIDTHFQERDRNPRLEMAVSYTTDKIGLGISEDTAMVFRGKKVLILGSGGIQVFK